MEKTINNELSIMQSGTSVLQDNMLKMDYSEFEKCFDVFAKDKILGMRILTSDVMQELVDFYNKTKIEYDIYIKI